MGRKFAIALFIFSFIFGLVLKVAAQNPTTKDGGISADWVLVGVVSLASALAIVIFVDMRNTIKSHGEQLIQHRLDIDRNKQTLENHSEQIDGLEKDNRVNYLIKENTEKMLAKLDYLKG